MNILEGKVAIVTGASKGIGAAIAIRLASEGASVIVNYSESREAADQVVESIKKNAGEALAVKADVSIANEVTGLFDTAIEKYGKINILVNNAGIMIIKPLKDFTYEEFDRQLNINVKGVFYALKEAAIRLADNGNIINLSSSTTRTILPGYASYAATKGAVEQLSRNFAKEVGFRGITVNSLSPGTTDTDLFRNGKPQDLIDRLASLSPFNRLGKPDEIAETVLFLASDQSKWITAQNIASNGGMA